MENFERRTNNLGDNERLVLFLGTERGLQVLQRIVHDKIGEVAAVCVQYDTGHGAQASEEIARVARDAGAAVYSSSDVKSSQYAELIKRYDANAALCINWRKLFPMDAVNAAHRGLTVAHDSLLPHLRGFAPLNHSLRLGENKTGVTLFYAAQQADSGDIIAAKETGIGRDEYVKEVRDRVTGLTVELVAEELPKILAGRCLGTPQDESKATFGVRLTPDDGRIDFSRTRREIFNLIRATSHPYPGAFTSLEGREMRVWTASLPEDTPVLATTIPGRVVKREENRGVFVSAGDGAILLENVEINGDNASADAFIRKHSTTLR